MSWHGWMAGAVEATSVGMLPPASREQEFHGCRRGDRGCVGALLRLQELHSQRCSEVLSDTRLASLGVQGPRSAPCRLSAQCWAVLQARAGAGQQRVTSEGCQYITSTKTGSLQFQKEPSKYVH